MTPTLPPDQPDAQAPQPVVTVATAKRRKPKAPPFSDLLEQARKHFKMCLDAESIQRQQAREDMDFAAGKQWPDEIKTDRAQSGRPCLVINRIPQFKNQVVNEQRQNRPAIQVSPRGNGAEKDTAEILEGLIRDIEVNSHADVAYDTAFDHAATIGFGWIRVLKEYVDEASFDQQLVIRRVPDPFKVCMDPNCQQPDFSDAKFAFVFDDLSVEEFKEQYPKADPASLNGFQALGDYGQYWYPENRIRIAEYFWVEETDDELLLMDDGRTVLRSELPKPTDALYVDPESHIFRSRKTKTRKVRWVKMSGVEILEETVWEGKWIPIVPVLGNEIILDGKRQFIGLVYFMKDAQRQYNYMRSAAVEMISLAPKAPYVAEVDQIADFKAQWESANVRNQAVLPYRSKSTETGQPLPPPMRQSFEPPIQAISQAIMQADMDLRNTAGMDNPALGKAQSDQSGKAILALQKEADIANFGLLDNLSRTQKHLGRILVEMIPHVYDAPRVVRIVKPDNSHELVMVNQMFVRDGNQVRALELPDGTPTPFGARFFDLANKMARYDVLVTVGPSYATKRQEAVNSILQLIQAFPEIMTVAGDLLVGYMDWNGAKEISERLKMTLPPALQQQDDQPIPPALRAKFGQILAQNQQLQETLRSVIEMVKTKKMELDSKERIALWNIEAGLAEAAMKAKSAEAQTLTNLDYKATEHRLNLLPSSAAAEAAGTAVGTPPEGQPGQPGAPGAPQPAAGPQAVQ